VGNIVVRFISPIVAIFIALQALACLAADRGVRFGEATTSSWRFGVVVKAPAGAITGIRATLPVPMDWPEQTVKKVSEEKSPRVGSVSYPVLDGGVKQMVVTIPRLAVGEEASAIVTFEITKREIVAPEETGVYSVPTKLSPALAKFLLPSPYIESTDPKIKAIAGEVTADAPGGWEQADAIFCWVRANIKYEFAEQIKPATAAMKDGQGDCEELSSLVIAMCRAKRIPARAVWIPKHTYPEFYLVDEKGQGHWFPCQAAGAERQFGSMREARPILQKGDNFKVPEARGPQRYVQQSLAAKNAEADPDYRFIMEPVEAP